MSPPDSRRVVAVAPLPPEKCAYALARYSRSADSIRQSIEWVKTHDERSFLDSYYFQYGHASIADLGHVVLCLEGISELAASEAEDETLWDGQAKSSRYQDFSRAGVVVPPELAPAQAQRYQGVARRLIETYRQVHQNVQAHLERTLPRPDEMKPEAYRRNVAARAFDVARYLLIWGVPTNVGQVTSIRTLEKQIRRLKASEYEEVRRLGEEMAQACAASPECRWSEGEEVQPLAPTLARHVEPDEYLIASRHDLRQWASQNLPAANASETPPRVDLVKPADIASDVVATLLYSVTDRPFRELYDLVSGWSGRRRSEVLDLALRSRARRDELPRAFRGGPYAFDIVMDFGAYRDLHRHRRCHQFRQAYGSSLGYETPPFLEEAGVLDLYHRAIGDAFAVAPELPSPANHYLLPLATRGRFLFKMDFAEAEYIARLRSGVKGHPGYRLVAWEMKQAMERLDPALGRLMSATPPWVQDPLQR